MKGKEKKRRGEEKRREKNEKCWRGESFFSFASLFSHYLSNQNCEYPTLPLNPN